MRSLPKTIVLVLLLALTSGCAGSRVVIVPSDRTVTFIKAGTTLTTTNNAVLIGEALWLDINEALAKRLENK
jgi:hypothetical protein